MDLTLNVWRQKSRDAEVKMVEYRATGYARFLRMMGAPLVPETK
jgi:hypothetical protein